MASVIVTCEGVARAVFIDNQNQGMTDMPLSVPEGLHVFDLGTTKPDYLPPFQEVFIEDGPGVIVVPFTLMAAIVERARKHRAAARKRVATDKRKRASARRRTARKAAARTRTTRRRRRSTHKKR
jgi:hypothetical protein